MLVLFAISLCLYGPGTAGVLPIYHHSFKGTVSRDGYSSRGTSPLIVLNALDDDFLYLSFDFVGRTWRMTYKEENKKLFYLRLQVILLKKMRQF
jgi:hypothetical protein